jgi:hypothetical protein
MFRKRILPLCALALFAATATAADNGFYLGAGVTQSQIDGVADDFDMEDTSFKLIAGFRPLDVFAVELNYMDLGSDTFSSAGVSAEAEATAIAGFGLLMLPLPLVDLYVKAGLAYWETEASSSLLPASLKDDGTEFAYGAGVQVRFWSLAARLEYESFDIEGTDGLDLFTLGVTYTFL